MRRRDRQDRIRRGSVDDVGVVSEKTAEPRTAADSAPDPRPLDRKEKDAERHGDRQKCRNKAPEITVAVCIHIVQSPTLTT